ncbi:pimeloyl-ACP methyl ester carboxylesterase [Luteibacter rhizovicinus]|uniref:Pimeloyl-ACP methyl ester carboxylesterase n=1 Tax=Luteibacter rhizovicinus TaxID=242606 RepID=A0A4V2W4S4_9GAMM|nr:alpha/beta hydrolase [Luteibacter rhizovicinus]TCV97039.1 pimeloyl-ACP methyl ester carboxylesterase [Luteibacter rhizovicinus]
MPKLEANGIAIEYESFGASDAEPILLVSGLGVQMIRWTVAFCELLASHGYRVIRFDNRDVGLSTHFNDSPVPDFTTVALALGRGEQPDVPYTLYDMADDAIGLLDALEIERAHIVGRSMGGMIAQVIASEHPHRALSLTSIMSGTGNPGLPPATPEAMAVLTRRAPDPSEDEEGFLAHSVAFSRVIAGPGYPFDEAAQRAQSLAEVKRAYNPAGFGRQIAAIAVAGDRRSRLNSIAIPTLVIHGASDPLMPVEAGEDTAANIGDATLLVFEGMGHDLPPALYEAIVRAIVGNALLATRTSA